jgi:type IV pilus assembly protein PilC
VPSFQYKAIDASGVAARGKLDAFNEVDLELRLKRMGLDLVTFRQARGSTSSAVSAGSISRQDLINFCFDLEQTSRAGIPLLECLRDLRDSVDNPRFRQVIGALLDDIEGGSMLSAAMSRFPQVFDEVFTSLVRAGEQTGNLTDVFASLSASLKWQDELTSQTKKLLIYPTIVFFVVVGVLLFLLIYLVPQIVGVLKTMRVELPLQTRVLIAVSGFVQRFWWLVIGLPAIVGFGTWYAVRSKPRAAFLFDAFKLRLPVIGPILQKIVLARFADFFALMYRSGITILDAIRTSEGIVGNRVIAAGMREASVQINAGSPMSVAFESLKIFPPLVIRMLRVGETTGALDVALANVSYFYNRDVRDGVDKALKLIEPTLTLVLGGMLALILFSVLTPIYDLLGQLKF